MIQTPLVDMTLMSGFPETLKTLRTQRDLTQARLAEMLGVSPRVYNRWEKGAAVPHLDAVVNIADILQVSLDELLGRSEPNGDPLIRNQQLRDLCHQVDQLSDDEQQALTVVIDSVLKRSKMTRVIKN